MPSLQACPMVCDVWASGLLLGSMTSALVDASRALESSLIIIGIGILLFVVWAGFHCARARFHFRLWHIFVIVAVCAVASRVMLGVLQGSLTAFWSMMALCWSLPTWIGYAVDGNRRAICGALFGIALSVVALYAFANYVFLYL
jgi:hypothetical protein